MLAEVDIIVMSADGTEIRLIVEAKLSVPDLHAEEEKLKSAMLSMSSPAGLLVTPNHIVGLP